MTTNKGVEMYKRQSIFRSVLFWIAAALLGALVFTQIAGAQTKDTYGRVLKPGEAAEMRKDDAQLSSPWRRMENRDSREEALRRGWHCFGYMCRHGSLDQVQHEHDAEACAANPHTEFCKRYCEFYPDEGACQPIGTPHG
jgi:hypothetical protein